MKKREILMKIYFVRHGKTRWNQEGRYQGNGGDSPLLPQSYDDIACLANYLHNTTFKVLYTSPLKRARDTALALQNDLGLNFPVFIDKRLCEFGLGQLEGMKFLQAEKRYPEQIKAFRDAPAQYDPSAFGGESFSQVISRERALVDELAKRYDQPTDRLILVGHGAALCALIRSLEGISLNDLRLRGGLANASLTVLQTDDLGATYKEIMWNQTDYLDRKLTAKDVI